MDKIKAFFTNKWTQLVSWLLIILGTVSLIIAGATAEVISNGVTLTFAIVTAIGALVVFITNQIKK